MDISVILSASSRSQTLSKALASVAAQELRDPTKGKVLGVDNNSQEKTRKVVDEFCRCPGRFRYLFEPKPGKSHALNAGIQNAPGNALTFIDENVILGRMWLQNLTAAVRKGEWVGVGGRILSEQTFTPPHWIALQSCTGKVAVRTELT